MKILNWVKNEVDDYNKLLRDYPPVVFTLFVLSLVAANIFANKELINYKYACLDCGTAFSWIMFLCMDVTCRHYGARVTIKLSLLALAVNLVTAAAFMLLSNIGGNWGAFYDTKNNIANTVLNNTFAGSPYIVMGSSIAFIASSIINAFLHSTISRATLTNGSKCKDHSFNKSNSFTKNIAKTSSALTFGNFALASWLSTFIAQFCDNALFSLIVSKVLFGWTFTQVFCCAMIQAVAELLCEVIFSPLGYHWCCKWQKNKIGSDYLNSAMQAVS